LRLDPLEEEERKEVVQRGLEVANEKNGFRTEISDDAMAYLVELSEGYPHFIQQFAYSAFEEDTDKIIDLQDVLSGAYKDNGALAQLGSKYFNEMYYGKISSTDYRRVLNAMAKHSDKWVVRKLLVEQAGVKETTLNNALNVLKSKNVIISDDSRQGFYRLPTKSFAAWINAINSVAQTSGTDLHSLFDDGTGQKVAADPATH